MRGFQILLTSSPIQRKQIAVSRKPSAIWHVQGTQAKFGPITNRKELVLADPILQNTLIGSLQELMFRGVRCKGTEGKAESFYSRMQVSVNELCMFREHRIDLGQVFSLFLMTLWHPKLLEKRVNEPPCGPDKWPCRS